MREIRTTSDNILSLVACAQDYGFEDDVLFDALAEMMGRELSDGEIEAHAKAILAQPGLGPEDYSRIKNRLDAFRNKYCPK